MARELTRDEKVTNLIAENMEKYGRNGVTILDEVEL